MYIRNNILVDKLGLFEIGFIVDTLCILDRHTTPESLQKYVEEHAIALKNNNYVLAVKNLHHNKAKVFFSYIPTEGEVNINYLEIETAA